MQNGTFEFDLTLPTNNPGKEVFSSENGQDYEVVTNEIQASIDTVTIKNLTHLTHFIVGDPETDMDDYNHVIINEFSVDGTSEWVELYNHTGEEIDLTSWVIDDNGGSPTTHEIGIDSQNTTIEAKSTLIINDNFGFNDTGDTIRLLDPSGNIIDSVIYSNDPGSQTLPGNADFSSLSTIYANSNFSSSNTNTHTWGFDAFSSLDDAINFAPLGTIISVSAKNPSLSNTLLSDVPFSFPAGNTPADVPSISFLADKTFSIFQISGTSTVIVPNGTTITRSDSQNFDVADLSAEDVSTNNLTGFDNTQTASGALQWGIPNTELKFSQSITVNILVGVSLNGQTLNVVRSTNGSSWTSDGIAAPATCTVANVFCTFQTTKASYFAATSTQQTQNTDVGGITPTSTSPADAPTCTDTAPSTPPMLISANLNKNHSVTLTWLPSAGPLTYYLVAYGTAPGNLQFGNPNVGEAGTTSYTVSSLSSGRTYYFKVRAGNGCAPGPYSNEVAVAIGGGEITSPASGFIEGILGTKVNIEKQVENPSESVESPKMNSVEGTKTSRGLLASIGSFFSNFLAFIENFLR